MKKCNLNKIELIKNEYTVLLYNIKVVQIINITK